MYTCMYVCMYVRICMPEMVAKLNGYVVISPAETMMKMLGPLTCGNSNFKCISDLHSLHLYTKSMKAKGIILNGSKSILLNTPAHTHEWSCNGKNRLVRSECPNTYYCNVLQA